MLCQQDAKALMIAGAYLEVRVVTQGTTPATPARERATDGT